MACPAHHPYGRTLAEASRTETLGGIVLPAATVAALVRADVAPDGRTALREARHGLLTIFSFVAGPEVKEEPVHGEPANPREATPAAPAALRAFPPARAVVDDLGAIAIRRG